MKLLNVTSILLVILTLLTLPVYALLPSTTTLKDKSALFIGDSLGEVNGGWAKYIDKKYKLKRCENMCSSGSTISTVNSPKMLINQLFRKKGEAYDFVIMEGGINDALFSAELGNESSGSTTLFGALNELICFAKEHFAAAKIGFIIPYSTPNAHKAGWWGYSSNPEKYYSVIEDICKKQKISVLNLFSGNISVNDKKMSYSEYLDTSNTTYLYDYLHPNAKGTKKLSNIIGEWLQTI